MTKKTLGGLLSNLRKERGWTLKEMAGHVGIPLSTLAKVEADQASLSYDKLQQLTDRLGITLVDFLASNYDQEKSPTPVMARRSVSSDENGIHMETKNYSYEYLCTDLREKRMVPSLVTIKAHEVSEFGEHSKHAGEEFVFVLNGAVEVHSQFYNPVTIRQGQGIYIDSNMRHAYVAKDCDEATVLCVCAGDSVEWQEDLIVLAKAKQSVSL
jgi:transcriptional regulator with XRE-family HTH domain